jgi:hypothetical protein
MVEEEAVHGTVTTSDKRFGEAADIETLHALLAIVATAQELHASVFMVRKEIRDLEE